MKIFIIILHFGDPEMTRKCIRSVLQNLNSQEVVVVDNDPQSRFKTGDLRRGKIKIIKNSKNLGYAGGMNVGVKYALSKGATHVLLLNNDTLVEEDFVSPLIQLFSKKYIGIAGPVIKFEKKGEIINDLGGRVNMMFGKTKHIEVNENEMLKLIQHDSVLEADYISGCSMLIKKDVFENIGFFDERFFLYYEDVDFCLRAKKVGFSTCVLPAYSVFHGLSSSVGKNSGLALYHQTRSGLYFAEKNLGIFRVFNFIFIFFQSIFFGRSAFSAVTDYLKGK